LSLRSWSQLFSSRDLRNALVGAAVVFGGLGLSVLTLYVNRTGEPRLATFLAILSLVSVVLILIFVLPPLARNAGREASQLNLPFEFTTGGAVFFVLILIVAFSAWNTGNNFLFLILSFLFASLIIGFLAGSICLRKLDVRMRFPETIFADESTPLLVGITNRKRFVPAFSVRVDVRGKERERSIAAAELDLILPSWLSGRLTRAPIVTRILDYFEYVPARGQLEAKSEHRFPHRGRFLIKDFELSTKFPFGFFRHRRRLPAREADLIVFPKIVRLDGYAVDVPTDTGTRSLARLGAGQDLLALRGYRPYDDLRSIDWKATARTRDLIVREFAADEEKNVTVILDPVIPASEFQKLSVREKMTAEQSGKPVIVSARFEEGASLAASILLRVAADRSSFRLLIGNDAGNSGMGRQHLADSLKRLALAEPSVSPTPDQPEPIEDLGRILDEGGNSHVFYITTRDSRSLSDEMRDQLNIITF
jgi:hypothetical protein